jgi:hypothetical protein
MIPKAPDAIRVTFDYRMLALADRAVRTWQTTDMREAIDLTEQTYPGSYITKLEQVYGEDD